jgi:hypothetical protein
MSELKTKMFSGTKLGMYGMLNEEQFGCYHGWVINKCLMI